MTLPDEIITTIGPIIESVAADMSRRYYPYGCDQSDMSQEGWLWCYSHPKIVMRWFDPDATEPKAAVRLLAKTLRNELQDVGEDLKAQHLGYSRDDLVYYSKAQARELLPLMFSEEAWTHPEQSDGDVERKHRSAPAEGGNWFATLADMSRAYDSLSEHDRDLLAGFHRDEWANKMMAQAAGVSEQTMSYRHDMAIKRLVDALGGPRPRPQHDADCTHPFAGRRALSNATARSIQSSYYEEE